MPLTSESHKIFVNYWALQGEVVTVRKTY